MNLWLHVVHHLWLEAYTLRFVSRYLSSAGIRTSDLSITDQTLQPIAPPRLPYRGEALYYTPYVLLSAMYPTMLITTIQAIQFCFGLYENRSGQG